MEKLHNARAILTDYLKGDELWGRFNADCDDILCYYRAVVEAHRKAGSASILLEQFDAVVTELEPNAGKPGGE